VQVLAHAGLRSLHSDRTLLLRAPSSYAGVIGAAAFWFTRLVISTGALTMAVRPKDVVDAAGEWLAAALAGDGFRWLRRGRLMQRQEHGLRHHIALAPSLYNRAGQAILVRTYVGVADPALRQWRIDHSGLVAAAADRDVVCGHLLGYAAGRAKGYLYGDPADGSVLARTGDISQVDRVVSEPFRVTAV
jgi:hypothetical protein